MFVKRLNRLLLLCMVLLAVFTAASAAEGEAVGYGELDLFQQGSFTGPVSVPDSGAELLGLDDDEEEQLYRTILAGIKAGQTQIDVSSFDLPVAYRNGRWDGDGKEDMGIAVSRAINDSPEFYAIENSYSYSISYTDGSGTRGTITSVTLRLDDYYTPDKDELFNAAVEKALSVVEEGMTDLEKALVLHDYLVIHCAYNWEVATRGGAAAPTQRVYNAYGALVDGNAVCQGYTMAYKLLLDRVGIDCTTATGINHIWNVVKMGEDWYHVDVTWDDPTPNTEGSCGHAFFLISDDQIVDCDTHNNWEDYVPECDSEYYMDDHAFNNVEHPFYWKDGGFYYIRYSDVYFGDLTLESVKKVAELPYTYADSAVWLGDHLYYVHWNYYKGVQVIQVMQVSLDTGNSSPLNDPAKFIRMASPDGYYSYGVDRPGLRLDGTGEYLEVVSSTRREVLLTVKVPGYPAGWNNAELEDGEHAAFVGITETEDGLQAGILVDDTMTGTTCTVLAAVYDGGKMVELKWREFTVDDEGLVVVDLGDAVGEGQTVCLMMADSTWHPLCKEFRPAA